jgi:hypothetical protein
MKTIKNILHRFSTLSDHEFEKALLYLQYACTSVAFYLTIILTIAALIRGEQKPSHIAISIVFIICFRILVNKFKKEYKSC